MIHGRIYLIINKINLKKYVGQTRMPVSRRWQAHKQVARTGKRYALSCAIRKYGEDGFIVVEIDEASTLEELNRLEVFYINLFNTIRPGGYNLDSGGKYYLTHPETKAKIAAANKGRPSARKGKKHKPESIEKMRLARKGKPPTRLGHRNTPEANAKISAARKGRPSAPHTEEFKRRLSERNRGNTYATGIPKTPEHRAKIGMARRAFNQRMKEIAQNG